jgi:hypothetical protein
MMVPMVVIVVAIASVAHLANSKPLKYLELHGLICKKKSDFGCHQGNWLLSNQFGQLLLHNQQQIVVKEEADQMELAK